MAPHRCCVVYMSLFVGACATAPRDDARESQVDSIFTARIAADSPGCAVGIYRDGRIVLAKGYGLASLADRRPITATTTFELGSVAKQFTALATLVLVQEKRFSLDDDVRRWVPELPDYGTPIRIRDLLYHTSGLRDYGSLEMISAQSVVTMTDFLRLMSAQRALNFTPGTQHGYSHSDYHLLAIVIERVTGEPFGRYLERTVLTPLGMTRSHVHDNAAIARTDRAFGHVKTAQGFTEQAPVQLLTGGSNIYTSVTDLHRWDRNFDEASVGGRAVIDEMLRLPLLPNGDTIPYAHGIHLDTYRGLRTITRGSNSTGTRTEIIRFPEQHFTVTTLCNGSLLLPRTLGERVADMFLSKEMQPASIPASTSPPVAIAASDPTQFAGTYRSETDSWKTSQFEVRDGTLTELLGDTIQTYTFIGNGSFSGDGTPGFHVTFVKDTAKNRAKNSANESMRSFFSFEGIPRENWYRMNDAALWRPTPSELAQYAGTYYCSDINSTWQLVSQGGRLLLRRAGAPDVSLAPNERGRFVGGIGNWDDLLDLRFEFQLDAAGRVTALSVSTPPGEGAAQHLRFERKR